MGEEEIMQIPTPIHSITLLRHGQSVANRDQILQGQMDSPLTEQGKLEAKSLADYWRSNKVSFDTIISSPLKRALETARIIADRIDAPIELEPHWKERHFGKAEGLSYENLFALRNHGTSDSIFSPSFETGESDWDIYQRAGSAIQILLQKPAGVYLIVAHGSIFNAALYCILGIPPRSSKERARIRFGNTAFAELEYDSGMHRWSLLSLNNHSHLTSIDTLSLDPNNDDDQ